MKTINVCPCTLAPGYSTYSPVAIRHFAGGHKVSHILPYEGFPSVSERSIFDDNRERMSLSGAQTKFSVVIDGGKFRLAKSGEQGTFILKPKLLQFENREFSPANEHLTMQIASQVYGIETAQSALCFSENGEAAYLTRRYDISTDGIKQSQEDFATLAGISKDTHGGNFKYIACSYEDIGKLFQKYLPAWRIEIIKYFDVLLFNFVYGNGDAHIKNFSALKTASGDYRLAPAYDLICTQLHIPGDSIFALDKGLYNGWVKGHYVTGTDFLILAERIGISEKIAHREIDRFCADYPLSDKLIGNSFLSPELKDRYRSLREDRINCFLKAR